MSSVALRALHFSAQPPYQACPSRPGVSLDGFSCAAPCYFHPFAQRRKVAARFRNSFSSHSSRCFRHLLLSVQVVLSDCLLPRLRIPYVLRHRWLPPLLLAPCLQNQPLVPVRHRLDGYVLLAKGRPLVGRSSPPSPPLLR